MPLGGLWPLMTWKLCFKLKRRRLQSLHRWHHGTPLRPQILALPLGVKDIMQDLRLKLHAWLLQAKIPCRLQALLGGAELEALFSVEEVAHACSIFADWMLGKGLKQTVSWECPEGQPYALHAILALSKCLQDKDSALFPALLAGVPTGFDNDIPPSGFFLSAPPTEHAFALDLAICQGNWQGAESDPASLQELIQAEEDSGCLLLGILAPHFPFGRIMRKSLPSPQTFVLLTKPCAFASRTRVFSPSPAGEAFVLPSRPLRSRFLQSLVCQGWGVLC